MAILENTVFPLLKDARSGLRALAKRPMISLLAIGSLALAIAGNTVVFSMVSSWLLFNWNIDNPDQITFVWQSKSDEMFGQSPVAEANFVDWQQQSRTLEHWSAIRMAPYSLTQGEEPESILTNEVSANIFPLLGVHPVLGRPFERDEEIAGRHRSVILSHKFWSERLGEDPNSLGTSLPLNGEEYSIVGVLAQDFDFMFTTGELFVPLAMDPQNLSRERRDLMVMAGLGDGISAEAAEQEMKGISKLLAEEHPAENRDYSAKVIPLPDQFPGKVNVYMFSILQALMLMVLLIACTNIANLLLAQGQSRQKEIVLRAVLGAGRKRILRQLLIESLVLSVIGGGLGAVLGNKATQALFSAFSEYLPASMVPSMDGRVLLFTLAISIAAGLVFGILPAQQASRLDLSQALSEGGRGGASSRRKRWITRSLVVAQMAGALIMLSGAALLVRSFLELQRAEPGFEEKNLLTFQMVLPQQAYPDDERVAAFYDQLTESLAALPGASSASSTTVLPRSPLPPSTTFYLGSHSGTENEALSATFIGVGESYLQTLEVPLLQGRALDRRDHSTTQAVVVVNRAMADRFWPNQDPLGTNIHLHGAPRQIVGVVGNVQQDMLVSTDEGFAPIVYLPQGQMPSRIMSLVIRTQGDPMALAPGVRETLSHLDPNLSASQLQSMEKYVGQFFLGMEMINKLLVAAGIVALLLASVGIYGVIAFSVAQRTQEIGIRMAVGARQRDVLRQVTWEGLVLALIGFVIGLPVVFALTIALSRLLSGLSSVSPGTTGVVAFVLLLIALAASAIPAYRASHLDPLEALRQD
ncbi:MAG: ABC transporter permease [Deltaproteobacteria bacterium]|nr:ABC transporter permease [Deltaproteobacteria bacterium]